MQLTTARLDLVCATPRMLRCEIGEGGSLGREVGAGVPDGWPPELFDADAVRWMLGWASEHPDDSMWGAYYLALRSSDGERTLVGTGGFKRPPNDAGLVEVGYSVMPAYRRRGIAFEAVGGWVSFAFSDPRVTAVIAHTFPTLVP